MFCTPWQLQVITNYKILVDHEHIGLNQSCFTYWSGTVRGPWCGGGGGGRHGGLLGGRHWRLLHKLRAGRFFFTRVRSRTTFGRLKSKIENENKKPI